MQWKSELQSALGICGSASTYSVNLRLCSMHLVKKKKKNSLVSEPTQFKVMWFKGQLYLINSSWEYFNWLQNQQWKNVDMKKKHLSLPSISLQFNMEAHMKINNYSTTQLDNIYQKRHETEIATISVKLSKWLRDRLFILFT